MWALRIYARGLLSMAMGQNYVGAAALHFLEGYHIESLELGTLIEDSTGVRRSLVILVGLVLIYIYVDG
jgi:hypothetical protein